MAEHNAALQRQAEQAVAAERARIARELHDIVAHHLSVVVLHAGSAHAEVRVGYVEDAVTIEVTDDGPGAREAGLIWAETTQGGRGLTGMRERVALFGGDLRAGPKPDGGFTVRARLPLGGEAS